MAKEYLKNPMRLLRQFAKDQSGMALAYVTLALPVVIGFGLLAVDLGRLSTLQSSLQHGADAIALAAAGELDRRPDAISRANYAINNMLSTNKSLFGPTTPVVITGSNVAVRYFSAIPGHGLSGTDADPMPSGAGLSAGNANDNIAARFVEVRVNPVTFTTIFPAAFLNRFNTTTSSAMAVAGFDAAVCKITPMFMCNPFEPTTGVTDPFADYGLFAAAKLTSEKRKLIAFKAHDQNSQWAPGNYGFLESYAGPGASALGDSIASTTGEGCFKQNGVVTKPGNMTVLKNAFNVRFDIYQGTYGNSQAKSSYPPGVNVRKGHIVKRLSGNGQSNACDHSNHITAYTGTTPYPAYSGEMELPRDSCFATSTCTGAGGRMGNGDWGGDTASSATVPDFEQYWSTNFGSTAIPGANTICGTSACSNTNLPTRYDIYRYEIANNLVSTQSAGVNIGGTLYRESGTPGCNTGAGIDNPDRRIIYGAIINCRAVGMSGGSGGPYQTVAFGKYFMTEPMGDPPDSTLWTELTDVVEPGQTNSVARDLVQLYR